MTPGARVRIRRLLARITGPAAITWWTWLITAPFAVTVMSGLQYVTGGPWAVLAVSSVAHILLGLVLIGGWALLRIEPEHSRLRVLAVALIFALVGAARPFLALLSGRMLGIPVQPGDLAGRIAINVVAAVAICSLIAAGVDLVHEHRAVFRRLRAARRASERDTAAGAERIRELRHSAVDEVLAEIESAAESRAADPIDARDAARLLRDLADDVVRPASHRLYDSELATDPASAVETVSRRREWLASIIGGMHGAPPVGMSLLFAALTVPFAYSLMGAVATFPLLVGFAVVAAGNVLVARIPVVPKAGLRLFTLALGYAAVGVLLSTTSELVIMALGRRPDLVWFEALLYPFVALGVAFVTSLSARTRQDQGELEAAVQASVQTAARVRADFEHERAALARLLHAGVQSELIAAALALGGGRGDASAELRAVVDHVRGELLGPRREPSAWERVGALVDSWRSAIPLEASIGDGVWERLEDAVRCAAVVDAMSEGLANAVRHGDGTAVDLEVRTETGGGVEVLIVSGGQLSGAQPGIGLKQLSEHGSVALREASGRVELAVVIP